MLNQIEVRLPKHHKKVTILGVEYHYSLQGDYLDVCTKDSWLYFILSNGFLCNPDNLPREVVEYFKEKCL